MRYGRLLILAVVLAASAATGFAAPARTIRGTLGTSVNELGLRASVDASWRWRLSKSEHPLLSRAHFTLGGSGYLSPTYARFQAWAVLAPLSVIELTGGVEPAFYFGTFGSLLGFHSYEDDFSREVRRERKDEAEAGTAMRWHAGPRLQFAAGPVSARSTLSWERWSFDAAGPFVYEPARDVLVGVDGDDLLKLDSAVLVSLGPGRPSLGLRHELTRVRKARANDISRLGPVALWEPNGSWLGLEDPVVFANVYYYLSDRSKEGSIGATLAVSVRLGSSE